LSGGFGGGSGADGECMVVERKSDGDGDGAGVVDVRMEEEEFQKSPHGGRVVVVLIDSSLKNPRTERWSGFEADWSMLVCEWCAMKEGLFVMTQMLVGELDFGERKGHCDDTWEWCGVVVGCKRVVRHWVVVARYGLYCG
ncbi:hypothetical protein A2U01_0036797, partial [Trifolium medium]|nr:hypothetical protein [Trifolium medium]